MRSKMRRLALLPLSSCWSWGLKSSSCSGFMCTAMPGMLSSSRSSLPVKPACTQMLQVDVVS